MALLGDEPLFAHADAAQELLEAAAVELAGRTTEEGLFGDLADDHVVGNAKPHLPRELVEPGVIDQADEHRAVDPESLGLFGRNWPPKLPAELLHPLVIGAAELLDRNLRAADLRQRRSPEAPEDVVDAPDGEACGQKAHHHSHDGAAKPIRGGGANSSKHVSNAGCARGGLANGCLANVCPANEFSASGSS